MHPVAASAAQVPREVAAVASLLVAEEPEVPVASVEAAASVVQAARVAVAAQSLPEAAVASAAVGAAAEPAAAWFAAEPAAPLPRTPHRIWPARSRLPATDESNVDYS